MPDSESAFAGRDDQADGRAISGSRGEDDTRRGDMKGGFRFFFCFYIISIPAIILILVVATWGLRFMHRGFVLREAEVDAIRMSKALGDSDMFRFTPTNLSEGRSLSISEAELPELDRRLRIFVAPFDFVKINVYDSACQIIYSSDSTVVGEVDMDSVGLKEALKGLTISEYRYKGEIWDIRDEHRTDVQIVESYMPVRDGDGQVIGCIEIYKDVTSDLAKARAVGISAAGVLAVTVLVVFATLMYVIRRAERRINAGADALRRSEEKIQRSYDVQTVLNKLLHLSLEDLTLEDMMHRSLDYITSIPWLALESKGAIFLIEDEPEVLALKAEKGLPEQLQKMCNRVPFGECVCGRAAATKKIMFVTCLDERHDHAYKGMSEHGHYCVPMLSSEKVIGVINTYVKEGHERRKREESFLYSAAAVVAGIVQRKRAEESLEQLNEELESAVRVLSGVTDVLIPRGTVFKRHKTK